MHIHSTARRMIAALLALGILCLAACTAADPGLPTIQTPTLSDDELPTTPPTRPSSDVDYEALAHAVFSDAKDAPAADFTWEESAEGLTLTAYHGAGGVVIIPASLDGKSVIALGDELFRDNTAIIALSIPDTVTSIGTSLLTGCKSLQVLRTPQMGKTRTDAQYLAYLFGATSAQGGAFKIGSALDTVILSDAFTKLDSQAFFGCYRLIMVILPKTLTDIGSYAFCGCSSLKYVTMPEALTVLGEGALSECTSLLSLTIPDSVKEMGLGALMGCNSLVELSVPFVGQTATENNHLGYLFGAKAYTWNASFTPASLAYLTVRHGEVGNYAFYECRSLYDIALPPKSMQIGVRAFHGCHNLLSVELPDGITHIGDMAFSDCRSLTDVTLSDQLVDIGMQTFMDCVNLKEIIIPDGVTMLPPSLFAGCKRLEKVTVSDALTTVDDAVFRHCISLKSFCTPSGAPVDADRVAIGRDNDALISCGVLPSAD
ncbi:MAG: leucine-rich repeat domain-containing protein [Clostridia bacterium]|nr:leucine-rich repeat domain-containing protein [Clostridia bacterium]